MAPLPIRRALISVSDKAGLDFLVRALHEGANVEFISTGGTARFIRDLGIRVTLVEDVTGFPEIMDGRVKTLHPKIHAALLARRDVPDHAAALKAHDIAPIDLLVVNLYPFEETVAGPNVSLEDAIENIDIGGPAMIRAAAKNHEHVAVVVDPSQYDELLAELRLNNALSLPTRRRLAAEAFARTAAYDSAITNFLAARPEFLPKPTGSSPWDSSSPGGASLQTGAPSSDLTPMPTGSRPWASPSDLRSLVSFLPPRIALPLTKLHDLRYGENPHQPAGLYALPAIELTINEIREISTQVTDRDAPSESRVDEGKRLTHMLNTSRAQHHSLAATTPLHGKPLSYNNLLDADAALKLARDLHTLRRAHQNAAVVVKHTNPCGAAIADTALSAIDAALAGDPLAAYGGIIATTALIDAPAAERLIAKGTFLEVVVARDFTPEALDTIAAKSKNVRLLALEEGITRQTLPTEWTIRRIDGGFLAQAPDVGVEPFDAWELRAGDPIDDATARAAQAIWAMAKALSSNAIAIGGIDPESGTVRLFGAGAGQMDRVASCRIAVSKAGKLAQGAIAASDAFFPFPDGPEVLIDAGVRTIIHPGGSKRDDETFALCARRAVSCYVTGWRHFRH